MKRLKPVATLLYCLRTKLDKVVKVKNVAECSTLDNLNGMMTGKRSNNRMPDVARH